MKRRRLTLSSFDALIAEVDCLEKQGYQRAGNWSLTQICRHLRMFQDMSMDGFSVPPSPAWQRAMGAVAIRLTLLMRWMPSGVRAPLAMVPPPMPEDAIEIEKFHGSVRRLAASSGPFYPSPFFGQLSPRQWLALHLIHAGHHLRFLIPNIAAANALMG